MQNANYLVKIELQPAPDFLTYVLTKYYASPINCIRQELNVVMMMLSWVSSSTSLIFRRFVGGFIGQDYLIFSGKRNITWKNEKLLSNPNNTVVAMHRYVQKRESQKHLHWTHSSVLQNHPNLTFFFGGRVKGTTPSVAPFESLPTTTKVSQEKLQ